ncbi:endonuclease domain-containing protein [Oxynema aestuarii]|uniref:Endonuclease domain-containing protein n=1 Tax=Oxynema aestuarii AP17 TaxID=2064643 RepID=A0A6H1TVQ0_9CYAN|nr:endonuclease domain-containing protein [Oxynema aestuarii]QIZ69833.1 endonuclease domain-containing protein [Oxynema aestuarii AP17]
MTKFTNSQFHLPYNPKLVSIAKQMRQNPTPAEKKLWQDCLRKFPLRILRQRPIDNFIVDFYCASLKLVIGIDGESHFTQQGQDYDEERTRILEGYGITVVRFTNVDVLQNFEGVCRQLERWIPPTPLGKGGF